MRTYKQHTSGPLPNDECSVSALCRRNSIKEYDGIRNDDGV